MGPVVLSELTRLNRRGIVIGWPALMALFAVMINTVMFRIAADGLVPPGGGPGVALPTAADLATSTGLTAGLAAAANLFGVVTLSFWAIVTATDYQTGLIRVLVSAEPRRSVLLAGKVLALAAGTAVATTVAVIVNLPVAGPSAAAAGIPTDAWTDGAVGNVLSAWVNIYLALLVWGVLGLTLAVLTRSAAIAISVGIGYLLVAETLIKTAAPDAARWLPGTAVAALAAGGSDTLSHGAAIAAGAAIVAACLLLAGLVVSRRPITD